MKLQFDSSQEYQLAAIRAVVDIFEGQPLAKGDFELSFAMEGSSLALTEKGVGNQLVLNEEQLLQNVRAVQERNGIAPSGALERCRYVKNQETGETDFIPLNFTVEMETGTGKTYTYLRTIYELNKVYGFKKFVIVVPSVAIREGTVKNLQITHDHFQALYGNPPINYVMYESKNLAALRNFATPNAIQILVINIDSFTKDTNVINTVRETGVKPIEYIQATCPFVIVDEPQNMETDVRRAALHNLNPLGTLRYSATHRNLYNLVYNLNPVQAYDLGLVKQIEVVGVTAVEQDYNQPYIRYDGCRRGKRTVSVKLTLNVRTPQGIQRKSVSVSPGKADLFDLSNGNPLYRELYVNSWSYLEDSDSSEIRLSNGWVLREKSEMGGMKEELLKYQIEQTVLKHFKKLQELKPKGIKVLSLFFIDRVANYREYTADSNPQKGKFAIWFEGAFTRHASQHKGLIPFSIEQVHNGYFSSDKKGVGKEKKEIWIDSKEKNTKADEDTYSLIMKEKERLLSLDEPLQFIFSHSALREGWDNPNVFQICTLNESKSDLKKRQEIGRGLRLPVDSTGLRVQDKRINVLTVVANETYEDFSEALQREIQEETSVEFKGRIKNARDKSKVQLSKELTLENFPFLFEIWEKIKRHTRYAVEYSTQELIRRTVAELRDFNFVPLAKRPMLEARTARLSYSEEGIEGTLKDTGVKKPEEVRYLIPDVYGYIQSRVDVSRNTVYEILKQSNRFGELEINPQMFLDNVIGAIRRTLNSLLVEGVKYEQINGSDYEMRLFEYEEIETYLSNLFTVSKQDKTLFNYIPVDSDVESDFSRDCEADENIKFFFKLPRGFKVPTPIGNYVPDWAVVFENDTRIYFVAETKGTLDGQLLREVEQMKIDCGAKHFALFKPLGVEYKLAVTTRDLYA
ncbi:DEAD/DEAH box helicase family protein [Candidatus Poribacteria bacterium]|nr:DEAD/DEAH box helicase family protein [Candidatus Poribacteria bacterium]